MFLFPIITAMNNNAKKMYCEKKYNNRWNNNIKDLLSNKEDWFIRQQTRVILHNFAMCRNYKHQRNCTRSFLCKIFVLSL